MNVAEIIDRVLPHPHLNREGLSYGQLAVVFVAFVLSMRNHRLSAVEERLLKPGMPADATFR